MGLTEAACPKPLLFYFRYHWNPLLTFNFSLTGTVVWYGIVQCFHEEPLAAHVKWPRAFWSDCLSWLCYSVFQVTIGVYGDVVVLLLCVSNHYLKVLYILIYVYVCLCDCSFNNVQQTVCYIWTCSHVKSCRYTFKFQRRVSLESSWVRLHPVSQNVPSGCPLTQPAAPQTDTAGRHLGSVEGGASLQLLQDNWLSGGTVSPQVQNLISWLCVKFFWLIVQRREGNSALNTAKVDATLFVPNPLCLFSFLPLHNLQ